MKTIDKRLKELGVSDKTIADVFPHLDIGKIITADEFNCRRKDGEEQDYRMRAIERMIRDDIPFNTNVNIIFEVFHEFIGAPACLRDDCKHMMAFHTASGSGETTTITYICKGCGGVLSIKLANDAISWRPGKKTSKKEPPKGIRPKDLLIHKGDFFMIRNAYYAVKDVKRGPDFSMTLDVVAPVRKEG
jgi:hypothetical protein